MASRAYWSESADCKSVFMGQKFFLKIEMLVSVMKPFTLVH